MKPRFAHFTIELNDSRWISEMVRWKATSKGFLTGHLQEPSGVIKPNRELRQSCCRVSQDGVCLKLERYLPNLVSSLESSLEDPRYSQEYLNHVTFAPPRGGRPDGAGWLPRRVRTDGRVNLSRRVVRARYEPCTFEQQTLFEDHSQHTFDRWRRPARDGRSGLPSTTLDHVSATERWSM